MADFKTPNLCGANEELNTALSKIEDLKNEISAKANSLASEASAAFESKLTEVKAGLDGLAIDIPEIPAVNFQSEITSLINDVDKTTAQGILAFNAKVAQLKQDFGDTLKEKGLTLDSLVTDATTKLSGGGNICDLVPNLEIPSSASGTGVTTQEIEERGTGTSVTLTQIPKEIISVQGKKTGVSFFGNIQYTQNGKVIVPKDTGTYSEIKVLYTVSLIKEKAVEAKQADTSPEPEEVSIVTTNVSSVENKTTFKFSSLIKKLDNLSGGSIDTTKANADVTKALSAIKSPEFKAKMQADLDYAAAERKKLFADPLNYKQVVVPSGSVGEKPKVVKVTTPEVQNTVKVETVTKTNPVTKQEETVTVKKTEKSTISINGIAMRRTKVNEAFYTKDAPETLAKKLGAKLVDDLSKITLKQQPYIILSIRGRPYYGEKRESRGFKYYAYDNPSEYGGDDTGVKYVIDGKDPKLIELSQQVYDDGEKQANPKNMTIMKVKYIILEKLDPNFKG